MSERYGQKIVRAGWYISHETKVSAAWETSVDSLLVKIKSRKDPVLIKFGSFA